MVVTKNIKCLNCGLELTVVWRPNRPRKYCTDSCAGKHTAKQRGDTQRFKGKKEGYVKLNNRHMHRVVMENYLGRSLASFEIVHHIDGNKQNNNLSNLKLMTRPEHSRQHSTKNRICSVERCGLKHHANGFCERHYRQ